MEMKSFLRDSPIQIHRAASADGEVGDEGEEPVAAAGEEAAAAGAGEEANGSDVSDVYEGSESENPETPSAPTLDGCDSPIKTPPMDSDGEYPDSQRPGAWMGNFYKKHAKHIKSPEPIEDQPPEGEEKGNGDSDADGENGGDDGAGEAVVPVESQPLDGDSLSESDGGEAEPVVSSWTDWKGEKPRKDGRLVAWVAEILYHQRLGKCLGDKHLLGHMYSKGFSHLYLLICGYRYQNLHAIRNCLTIRASRAV